MPKRAGGRAAPGTARAAVGVEQRRGGGGVETALAAGAGGRRREPAGGAGIGNAGAADQVGAARTGVFVAAAVDVGRRERNARFPRADAGDLPAAQQEVGHARGVLQEMLVLAEREFVEAVEVEHEAADAVFAAVIDVVVPEEVVVGEIEGAGPGEVALELQSAGEALLAAHLQRVELHAAIVAEVLDALGPAELLEEEAALVGAERTEADDGRLVDVVVGAAGRDVVALVADVADGEHRAGRELVLEGEVPGIDHRQPHGVVAGQRQHVGRDAVGQHGIAVRSLGLRGQDGGGVERRRALSPA